MSTLLRRVALPILSISVLLLSGCGGIFSSPTPRNLYRVTAETQFPAGLPHLSTQLTIDRVSAPAGLDTDRIALTRSPVSIDYFADAAWTDRVPNILRVAVIQSFENSGVFAAIGADTFIPRTDYLLTIEVRDFEAVYDSRGSAPIVTIGLALKLLKLPGRKIVAQTVIRVQQPAPANAIPSIVETFNTALHQAISGTIRWTADNAALSWRRP